MYGALASVAADATDPVAVITSGTTQYLPEFLAIGAAAIAISAGTLVLRKGWGFFTKLVRP